jgi:DNA-binding IclR family transcriptional regulator
VQAVDRAVQLLLTVARQPATLAELASRCGIARGTAWRLLATLEHHGLVDREPMSQRYAIGWRAVEVGGAAFRQHALLWQLRPHLEQLLAEVGETVNLSVAAADTVVCISQLDGPHLVTVNWLGRPLPLHASSNGKCLLASLTDSELEQFLRRPLPRFTPHTVIDPQHLRAQLEEVRRQGYGVACGEYEEGFNGVSAAVTGPGGRPVAFVSVSGPAYRVTTERLEELGPRVVEAARSMSRALVG